MIFFEQLMPVLFTMLIYIAPIALLLWFVFKVLKNQQEQSALLKEISKKLDNQHHSGL
ncbi:hypothetical protein [Domibacillus enclensis]|uniref:Uncharacterized protein n=1 Tax=Domibacillus enclensis TaxID=1017273 RepID=A0A1N6VAI9_9BACI|nr:hypothetical protein [Domibacillus enclensis]SIQ74778.1 hypothetical protein SAMN05443094_103501 [Domibacillus enclensis]